MKDSTKQIFVFLFALVYLTSCIGFTAVSHYCHRGHHPMGTAASCSCADLHIESGEVSCHAAAIAPTSSENLASAHCCEIIPLYHQVEDTAPLTVALSLLTSTEACILLPALKNPAPAIGEQTHIRLASLQRTLPLLI